MPAAKSNLKLLLLACMLYITACSWERSNANSGWNSDKSNIAEKPGQQVPVAVDTQLVFSENFSQGRKKSYAPAQVVLSTGTWLFDDVLIDEKTPGTQSAPAARIRNEGRLSMQFDTDVQVGTVEVMTTTFGKDKVSQIELRVSYDGGRSFESVQEKTRETRGDSLLYRFKADALPGARFEVGKVSGGPGRINIIYFKAYAGAGAGADQGQHTSISDIRRKNGLSPQDGRALTDDSDTLLGNPSRAVKSHDSPENYLISNPYYTLSYSKSRASANWASWHISKNTIGDAGRQNDFRPAETLPEGWYRVDERAYKSSGFDKGHNCPSADRTASRAANSSTFLMYNIIPQAPQNNQKIWEHLESYCRNQVNKGNEVYVIMGSYGKGGTGRYGYRLSIDSGRIAVPSRIWKVVLIIPEGNNDLLRINENTRVIAISTPNTNEVSANWMDYICTVREIEKVTGYDLFSSLPKALQERLENRRFKGGN